MDISMVLTQLRVTDNQPSFVPSHISQEYGCTSKPLCSSHADKIRTSSSTDLTISTSISDSVKRELQAYSFLFSNSKTHRRGPACLTMPRQAVMLTIDEVRQSIQAGHSITVDLIMESMSDIKLEKDDDDVPD